MPKKPPNPEGKEIILAAALDLFHKKGYMGTSMDDIARAVGLTKGGLYHYVGKKEELLKEIFDRVFENFSKRLTKSVEKETDPVKKLENWIRAHGLTIEKFAADLKVFYTETHNLDTETCERTLARRDLVSAELAQIIACGQEAGTFRKDLDPGVTGYLILGMMNWFYQWYRPEGRLPMEAIIDQAIALVSKGVMGDTPG